jgi:glutamine---fructose-6-phosphate transaminase (isomerizing)
MGNSPDWHTDAFPELRAAPPWVMQEMIAAQPALVAALLSTPPSGVAAAGDTISKALAHGRPVTVCGCGTSEHAAQGIAAMLAAAVGEDKAMLIRARPAFSAAQDPTPGVCVAISHDGATRATVLSLNAARSAGARTIAITHQPDGAVAQAAELALVTPVHDDSWCHTVAYTSALAVGATLAAQLGPFAADPAAARGLLERATSSPEAASIAARLADRRVILCAGAEAADLATARELALKIAEATHVPTLAVELETVLHGQLAACEPADALVLVAITRSGDPARTNRRATDVAHAAAAVGLHVAGLISDAYAQTAESDLIPDGKLITQLAAPELLDARLSGLLAGAGALQSLTLELAHARHTNPDLIRREQAPYRQAAAAAENSADW